MRRSALLALAFAALLSAPPAPAQPRLPFPSPAASVSQEIGTSRVSVEYHRPAVRGRPIWGAKGWRSAPRCYRG